MVMLWGCHRTSAPMRPMTSANLHASLWSAAAHAEPQREPPPLCRAGPLRLLRAHMAQETDKPHAAHGADRGQTVCQAAEGSGFSVQALGFGVEAGSLRRPGGLSTHVAAQRSAQQGTARGGCAPHLTSPCTLALPQPWTVTVPPVTAAPATGAHAPLSALTDRPSEDRPSSPDFSHPCSAARAGLPPATATPASRADAPPSALTDQPSTDRLSTGRPPGPEFDHPCSAALAVPPAAVAPASCAHAPLSALPHSPSTDRPPTGRAPSHGSAHTCSTLNPQPSTLNPCSAALAGPLTARVQGVRCRLLWLEGF